MKRGTEGRVRERVCYTRRPARDKSTTDAIYPPRDLSEIDEKRRSGHNEGHRWTPRGRARFLQRLKQPPPPPCEALLQLIRPPSVTFHPRACRASLPPGETRNTTSKQIRQIRCLPPSLSLSLSLSLSVSLRR